MEDALQDDYSQEMGERLRNKLDQWTLLIVELASEQISTEGFLDRL